MQTLAALKPAFAVQGEKSDSTRSRSRRYPEVERINHVHHAGNSSGIVDGAAAVLIGTKEAGERQGLKPRARIRGFTSIGSEPSIMLTGPVDVAKKLFKHARMTPRDIELYELNEAFASVVMLLHGRARHPARQDERQWRRHRHGPSARRDRGHDPRHGARRDGAARPQHGLATLCVGLGMGTATIIERV